jgi:hypothetical protein
VRIDSRDAATWFSFTLARHAPVRETTQSFLQGRCREVSFHQSPSKLKASRRSAQDVSPVPGSSRDRRRQAWRFAAFDEGPGRGVAIETGLDPDRLRHLIHAHETRQNFSEHNNRHQEDFGGSSGC